MNYFKFQPDIHSEYGIAEYPTVAHDISFVAGKPITLPLPHPLVFEVTNPQDQPPGHLLGAMIPVASARFVDALSAAGVDNIQTFPAILRNNQIGTEWADYFALNIIGLVNGADMSASAYDTIIGEDSLPPLVAFSKLVLLRAAVDRHLMFRIVQSPLDMFMAEEVRNQLIASKPPSGWGITTTEVVMR